MSENARRSSYDERPPSSAKAARKAWDYFAAKYGPPSSIGCGRNEFGQWNWVSEYSPDPAFFGSGYASHIRHISCYSLNQFTIKQILEMQQDELASKRLTEQP